MITSLTPGFMLEVYWPTMLRLVWKPWLSGATQIGKLHTGEVQFTD